MYIVLLTHFRCLDGFGYIYEDHSPFLQHGICIIFLYLIPEIINFFTNLITKV
uniref:Uncharacterized protein n=1 Tax=Anguilla anguilla TaxID=7936 RepID=A0A0E9SQC7_ANGAN